MVDSSFISLRLILPAVLKWLQADAHVVALIKPQFEAGRDKVGKGGVVRDPAVHAEVLRTMWETAGTIGLSPIDLVRSPIEGPAGNVEFLIWLRFGRYEPAQAIDQLIHTLLLDKRG